MPLLYTHIYHKINCLIDTSMSSMSQIKINTTQIEPIIHTQKYPCNVIRNKFQYIYIANKQKKNYRLILNLFEPWFKIYVFVLWERVCK